MLDIRLREVGAKRHLNGIPKVNTQTDTHTHTQTDTQHRHTDTHMDKLTYGKHRPRGPMLLNPSYGRQQISRPMHSSTNFFSAGVHKGADTVIVPVSVTVKLLFSYR